MLLRRDFHFSEVLFQLVGLLVIGVVLLCLHNDALASEKEQVSERFKLGSDSAVLATLVGEFSAWRGDKEQALNYFHQAMSQGEDEGLGMFKPVRKQPKISKSN